MTQLTTSVRPSSGAKHRGANPTNPWGYTANAWTISNGAGGDVLRKKVMSAQMRRQKSCGKRGE